MSIECPYCCGVGEIVVEYFDDWPRYETCNECNGLGILYEEKK